MSDPHWGKRHRLCTTRWIHGVNPDYLQNTQDWNRSTMGKFPLKHTSLVTDATAYMVQMPNNNKYNNNNSSTYFCTRSSSCRTDILINFQLRRHTTTWMLFLVTLTLSLTFDYETNYRKYEMPLDGWHCSLRFFTLGRLFSHRARTQVSSMTCMLHRPERYLSCVSEAGYHTAGLYFKIDRTKPPTASHQEWLIVKYSPANTSSRYRAFGKLQWKQNKDASQWSS